MATPPTVRQSSPPPPSPTMRHRLPSSSTRPSRGGGEPVLGNNNVRTTFCWPIFVMDITGIIPPTMPLLFWLNGIRRRYIAKSNAMNFSSETAGSATKTEEEENEELAKSNIMAQSSRRIRNVWHSLSQCGRFLGYIWTVTILYDIGLIVYALSALADWSQLESVHIMAITTLQWLIQQLLVSMLFKYMWHRSRATKDGGMFVVLEKWNEDEYDGLGTTNSTPCVQARYIARLPKLATIIGLSISLANILVVVAVAFNWFPSAITDLFVLTVPTLPVNEPWRSLLYYPALAGYIGASLYWSMITTFIVLVAFVLSQEFKRIADRLEAAHERRQRTLSTSSMSIEQIRRLHLQVFQKVEKCDDAFHAILAVIYGTNISILVFNFYQIIMSSGIARFSMIFWLVIGLFQLLVIGAACGLLNGHAHRPLNVLYDIASNSAALATDESRLELLSFLNMLTRTTLGLSVWRFVIVTREFIISLAAYLITLLIVIIQFRTKSLHANELLLCKQQSRSEEQDNNNNSALFSPEEFNESYLNHTQVLLTSS